MIPVVASLAACTGNLTYDTTPFAITFDACEPLQLVPASPPTQVQSEGLAAAEAMWRDHGAPKLGTDGGATLEVRFEDAADPFHGQYDDVHGIVYINQRLTEEPALSIVIAHELGHAMGLFHVKASHRKSLMNPGNVTVAATPEDQAALAAVWGDCQ